MKHTEYWQNLQKKKAKRANANKSRTVMYIMADMIMREKHREKRCRGHVLGKKELRERLLEDLRNNGARKEN